MIIPEMFSDFEISNFLAIYVIKYIVSLGLISVEKYSHNKVTKLHKGTYK